MWKLQNWKATVILSIIIPISMLATFRLTGITHEPQTPETITAEAINWNMTRPSEITTIDEWIQNSYTDDIHACLSAHVTGYRPRWPDWPSWGGAVTNIGVSANASVSNGFIHSIIIRFHLTSEQNLIYIILNEDAIKLENLTTNRIEYPGTPTRLAYFAATGLDRPSSCSSRILSFWTFTDDGTANHSMTTELEVTYFNGTAYRRVIIPTNLEMLGR